MPRASGHGTALPTSPSAPPANGRVQIGDLMQRAAELDASDLHLKVGRPPALRVWGELHCLDDLPPLSAEDLEAILFQVTNEEQRARFAATSVLDVSCAPDGAAPFRVNVARQRGTLTLAIRRLLAAIPPLDDLRLPSVCKELVMRPRGLLLVTGPAGSGRSTTLASMVEYLNERRAVRIVTCEDPIEYVFADKRAFITQRELGRDTPSYADAVRAALRQDPDVILVGALADVDTIEAALVAAETGHLVLSSLHTTGAAATLDRLVDVFPEHKQQQIRVELANVLEGILSQALLPTAAGQGRVAAVEVLLGTAPVRNLIREGKTQQIPGLIETSQRLGMRSMDQALLDLYRRGTVTFEEILSRSANPERLQALSQGRMSA
jgi:twitching motility protein PilT